MTGFARVAVVGVGLIGGSVARRLHARGADVVVVDPDAGTRAAASAAGLAVADVLPADRDLVVLATPLDALPAVLADAAVAAPDAVVVDVGSVKVAAARAAATAGLAGRYVGAHPMAGTEQSGFEHSYPDLLVGVRWAVARGDGPVPVLARVVRFVVEVFGATAVVLDADEHDRAVGLVSHAPHVLANALLELAERAEEPTAAHLAAGSFRDGTRVAGRNAGRTRNMLADNADALTGVLDDLAVLIAQYRSELADPDALGARLQSVVDGSAPVRRPDADWRACPDLDAVLAGPGPLLVRAGPSGLEWAPARS